MSTNGLFAGLATLSGVLFVTSSMLGMGRSLTVTQILRPLKKPGRVVVALAANFVLVPLLAWLITLVLPVDQPLKTGLLILAASISKMGVRYLPQLCSFSRKINASRKRAELSVRTVRISPASWWSCGALFAASFSA